MRDSEPMPIRTTDKPINSQKISASEIHQVFEKFIPNKKMLFQDPLFGKEIQIYDFLKLKEKLSHEKRIEIAFQTTEEYLEILVKARLSDSNIGLIMDNLNTNQSFIRIAKRNCLQYYFTQLKEQNKPLIIEA